MADLPSEAIAERLNVKWIRKLGNGGYGEVFEAIDLSTNRHVAIKAVHLSNRPGARKADLRKEVDLQQAVGHHPNIVQAIKKACWNDDTYWICMELCKGGDLYDVIEDHRIQNQHIQEHTIWRWFSQLVLGIQACHQPQSRTSANADTRVIVHRDLKPDNIFFNEDLTVAKIGDFGMARELKEEEWATSFCGTLTHMAPEMLVEGQTPIYDERVDLWALGCILYKLCSLDYAYDHSDDNTLKHKIRTERPAPIPVLYSRSLADLVDALLNADASKRPDLDQLIAHPGVQLGIVMDTARESASHMIRLEEENAQQAHSLKQAEVVAETLQAQLNEQRAYYQDVFNQGKARIEALEKQLREEQLSTQDRAIALEAREESLRLREDACDVAREQLEHQQRIATYMADIHASAEASLGQRQLDVQLRQDQLETALVELAAKEKALTAREEQVARQAEQLAATSTKAKPATVLAMNPTPVLEATRAVKASGPQARGHEATSASASRAIQRVAAAQKPALNRCTVAAVPTQSFKTRRSMVPSHSIAQKDVQSRQQASKISLAVTAKKSRSAEAGKREPPLPRKPAPYPRSKAEISSQSAVVSRTTTAGRTVPAVKSAEASTSKAVPSASGAGFASKTSLPVRGERPPMATRAAKPTTQDTLITRRAYRSAQKIMADADAVIARRAQQQNRVLNATETKSVSGSITRPKAFIRSTGDIRAKEKAIVNAADTDSTSSSQERQPKALGQVSRIAKPILENGTKRAFQEAFTDTQLCPPSTAPKRARPSLIPLSTRLHPSFMPRPVAFAAC